MKTNRLYRILRIIYTTCLWKPDLFTLSFLIPWSSYWKEQWSSHHEQRKKDQPCSNCKWSFLEVSEQPFSECNLNVIVNVIGVFRGFPIFSQIDRNRWKIRLFGTYIVSNLSPVDASSPVSRTLKPLANQGVSLLFGTLDPPFDPHQLFGVFSECLEEVLHTVRAFFSHRFCDVGVTVQCKCCGVASLPSESLCGL